LFLKRKIPENVILPQRFWEFRRPLLNRAKTFIQTSMNEDDKKLVTDLVNELLLTEEDADYWKLRFDEIYEH
jgi:hypothetical protein